MNFTEHYDRVESRISSYYEDVELTESIKEMVMSSCDVKGILESWNVQPELRGNQWMGYCPDHFLHDGHAAHAKKWFMSARNGDCMCFTSSKASNFIYIAKRIYRLSTIEETIKTLTNGERLVLPLPDFVVNPKTENYRDEQKRKNEIDLKKGITMVKRLISRGGHLSDNCLQYFAEDGINKDTLDFLGVCSIENGPFAGRAIIPFLNEKREICGYVAVNYMGKQWWVKQEYDKMKKIDSSVDIMKVMKSYRKTLYCKGFLSRNHMYGRYEVLNGGYNLDKLVIVEGERDAMKLLQEGIDCVSVHGTSIKEEQLVMLKEMNPHSLILGFDMDEAGCKATIGAYDSLFSEVESVSVMNLPGGKDPKKFNREELLGIISDAEFKTGVNYMERKKIFDCWVRKQKMKNAAFSSSI